MDDLAHLLVEAKNVPLSAVPIFFDLSKETDAEKLSALFTTGAIRRLSDDYREAQLELFGVNNPSRVYTPDFKNEFNTYYEGLGDIVKHGMWVYFPWISTLTHILTRDDFFAVRTARNKNLITKEEQEKFYNASIGIAGLSVGSSVAFAIALQGGGGHLKHADMDHLALSNTNRVLAGTPDLGQLKVDVAARRIYEINPYAHIETFAEGIHKENIGAFFDGLDIIIDELDDLSVKYLIREEAKKHGIAVVMAADNGDNAVVDVERYDLDANTPFFQGRLGTVTYEELASLDKFGIGKTITKHIGPENVTVRMQESLLEMGKTIVSWPQLGGAALINGAAGADCVRRMLTGHSIEGNRALISRDERLIPEYQTDAEQLKRRNAAESFRKIFGL